MGLRLCKPKPVPEKRGPPGPRYKVLIHGSALYRPWRLIDKVLSGDIPLGKGLSSEPSSVDKYVDIFPWDQGGRCGGRAIFRHSGFADVIIYVIDDDVDNLQIAKDELDSLLRLEKEPKHTPLIILLNDNQGKTAKSRWSIEEIKAGIEFDKIPPSSRAVILPCSIETTGGFTEAIKHLRQNLLGDENDDFDVEKIPDIESESVTTSVKNQVEITLQIPKPAVPESA